MSTDFSIRPLGISGPSPNLPAASPAAAEAVATELPPGRSVTAAEASAEVRNELVQTGDISRQVVFDRAAASFVFQVVNERTEVVVAQFPDEAMLRRRAYFHALDLSKSDPSRSQGTDRKV